MRIILIAFISGLAVFTQAQKATYIGFSAGVCYDVNKFVDPGPYLYGIRCSSGAFGIIVRQELNKIFSLETGVFSKYYATGFGVKLPHGGAVENNFQAAYTAQLPLRLNCKINLYKDKISILPTVGVVAVFNLEHGNGDSSTAYNPLLSSSIKSNSDSLFYYVSRWRSTKHLIPLIQTGITVEFKLGKKFMLDAYFNYYTGFSHIEDGTVVYNMNNSGTLKNKLFLNGSYSNFGVSLLYRVGAL